MNKVVLILSAFLFSVQCSFGQWGWEYTNLSEPKSQMGVASLGTKVYFAGGYNNGPKDKIEIYDVKTGQWTYDSLSEARILPVGVSCGSKVFFAGGAIFPTQYFSNVDIYDTITRQWTVKYLSVPRFALSAVSKGNKVLFAGGINAALNEAYDGVDIYNAETGSWEDTKYLSQPRGGMGAAVVGDLAIFAGGYDLQVTSDRVDIYNFTTGLWDTATLSEPRGFVSATSIGNKVLIAGGFLDNFDPSSRVDIYDVTTGTWTTTELSIARCAENVFRTIGGKAFYVGGGTFASPDFTDCSYAIDVYDSAGNPFPVLNLTAPLVWHSVIGAGNKLLVAGGRTFTEGVGWVDQGLVSIMDVVDRVDSQVNRDEFFRIYPNPVSQSATFSYTLEESGQAAIQIFNSFGQLVAEPINMHQMQGEQKVTWDAINLPAGIYFYRIEAGQEVGMGKMVVVN